MQLQFNQQNQMYLTYANSSLPSHKSLQHWTSVIME